jgi:hypothetical protein
MENVWYLYGLVLLAMLIAVGGAAMNDVRLAKAAVKAKAK